MKSKGDTIVVDDQLVCYDDSLMLKRLSAWPYVQLGIVFILVVVALFALLASKKAEQNKVWVGLSKETAHQLGTPISSLMAWVELLKENYPGDELIPEMDKDVKRLELVAERFSKIGSLPELVDGSLNEVLKRVTDYMDRRTSKKVDISFNLPVDEVIVKMNKALIEWVVENLCKNAVDAMEGDGKIELLLFEEEDRAIVDGCILIHEDQPLQDRDEIAAMVGLTPERVRQKRNKLIESLAAYFATYRAFGFVDKCPYNYQMSRVNEDINATEGTDFSLHFVNWVLASTFDEIAIFGDVLRTLTGYYDKHFFVCLAPANLCQYMDFNAFLEDVETRLTEKRIDEEKVNLRNLIDSHLKTQYCEDEMPDIETACRSILFLHYPVEVDFGQVIFKPNARKNNTLVIEEILRAAGHPMTLEEIYEEFIYQYPERYTEMNSLRGSINNNPNILPIGRTSTYTLTEWESDEHKGGSIRSIVIEYLDQQDLPIALIPEIVDYVCKFRPTTDEKNIVSNISLDKSGQFGFYYRNGERYIGLTSGDFPQEFFPVESSAKSSAANSIWYPKILSFIEERGHFPFSSGVDDEEKQLCHFWMRQERYYANGELDSHALIFFERVTSQYGHLRIDKKGHDWKDSYERVKKAFETKDFSEMDDEAGKWLSRNLREHQYHKDSMPEWKREGIEYIISLFSSNEQCTR